MPLKDVQARNEWQRQYDAAHAEQKRDYAARTAEAGKERWRRAIRFRLMVRNLLRESLMTSFELDIIDEKSRAGSEFMFRIAQELQRAFLAEKKANKITQQSIAEKLDTSRAVINRQLQGLENVGLRRIGELFWAMGWEPHFEARKIPERDNHSAVPVATNLCPMRSKGRADGA